MREKLTDGKVKRRRDILDIMILLYIRCIAFGSAKEVETEPLMEYAKFTCN